MAAFSPGKFAIGTKSSEASPIRTGLVTLHCSSLYRWPLRSMSAVTITPVSSLANCTSRTWPMRMPALRTGVLRATPGASLNLM